MYEIKRRAFIREEMKIGDEVLKIEVAPDAIVREYQTASVAVVKAQDAVKAAGGNPGPEVVETLGEAVVAFLGVTLGKENAEKLLTFFEGNYTEMLLQVMPFVLEVIVPQIEAGAADLRNAARDVYKKGKYGKKWRR